MTESLEYQVSPVNQDLQAIQLTQEAWDPRWLKGLMEKQDLKAC